MKKRFRDSLNPLYKDLSLVKGCFVIKFFKMGQYYKPVNTKNLEWLYSHHYGSGLKLMEHSWLKNDFVRTVESLLAKGGRWYQEPIVWAGDYHDEDGETNYYGLTVDENEIKPKVSKTSFKYLLNHTKRQFIDKIKIPNNKGWIIHPLPLITCLGNGRGGGDYRHQDRQKLIGSWANDIIEPTNKLEKSYDAVHFDLIEK